MPQSFSARRRAISVIESGGFLASTTPGKFDLSDWYSDLSLRQSLGWFEVHERFYESGSLEGLRETEKYLLRDSAGRIFIGGCNSPEATWTKFPRSRNRLIRI